MLNNVCNKKTTRSPSTCYQKETHFLSKRKRGKVDDVIVEEVDITRKIKKVEIYTIDEKT
jgi:hypothetical protein